MVKYSHGPGHKCSGYAHPPLWGEDGLCNLLTGKCGKTGEVGEITEAIANPPPFHVIWEKHQGTAKAQKRYEQMKKITYGFMIAFLLLFCPLL